MGFYLKIWVGVFQKNPGFFQPCFLLCSPPHPTISRYSDCILCSLWTKLLNIHFFTSHPKKKNLSSLLVQNLHFLYYYSPYLMPHVTIDFSYLNYLPIKKLSFISHHPPSEIPSHLLYPQTLQICNLKNWFLFNKKKKYHPLFYLVIKIKE